MNENEFKDAVKNLPLAKALFLSSIGSTNTEALKWLEEGVKTPSLVFADEQLAGRGRMQRRWVTNPESALALSLILKPEIDNEQLALYSPLAALALCQVLEEEYQLQPEIKWPNDVLLDKKKTCGILVEAAWNGQELLGIVVGIGVNVASQSLPPAEELLFPATCIEEHINTKADRSVLLGKLTGKLIELDQLCGTDKFFREYKRRLAFKEQAVNLCLADGSKTSGKIEGIAPNGDLILNSVNGQQQTFSAGDVRLRPD